MRVEKEERWSVISSKPELVTLQDGRVISMSNDHPPVRLVRDSRFKRLRDAKKLRRVMVPIRSVAVESVDPVVAPVTALAPVANPEVGDLDQLDLASRIISVLHESGYGSLDEIRRASDDELLDIDGIGQRSLDDIREALSKLD